MPTRRSIEELSGEPHATVFPDASPRTIRLSLAAGESVDAHSHPGHDVVLYVIEGALEVTLDDEVVELASGDVVHADGDRSISPTAVEDTTALVVLARRVEGD